jgi:hypothetical protein
VVILPRCRDASPIRPLMISFTQPRRLRWPLEFAESISGYGWIKKRWEDGPGKGRRLRTVTIRVSISFIQSIGVAPVRYHVVKGCATKKDWEALTKAAASYEYAEHGTPGSALRKWPNSTYEIPPNGNNSNSFVRKILQDGGYDISANFFSRWQHPGAWVPDAVNEDRSTPAYLTPIKK